MEVAKASRLHTVESRWDQVGQVKTRKGSDIETLRDFAARSSFFRLHDIVNRQTYGKLAAGRRGHQATSFPWLW